MAITADPVPETATPVRRGIYADHVGHRLAVWGVRLSPGGTANAVCWSPLDATGRPTLVVQAMSLDDFVEWVHPRTGATLHGYKPRAYLEMHGLVPRHAWVGGLELLTP